MALDFSATDQSEVRGLAINDFFGGGSAAIRAGNGTVIDGNFIGTDVTGTTAIPNWDGIILSDAGGVTIGGPDPSQRNLISGNDQSGIAVFGNSDEVSIEGNFIGTDATGNAAIPNRNGVFVAGNNSTTTTTDPEDLNQFLTIGRQRDLRQQLRRCRFPGCVRILDGGGEQDRRRCRWGDAARQQPGWG